MFEGDSTASITTSITKGFLDCSFSFVLVLPPFPWVRGVGVGGWGPFGVLGWRLGLSPPCGCRPLLGSLLWGGWLAGSLRGAFPPFPGLGVAAGISDEDDDEESGGWRHWLKVLTI